MKRCENTAQTCPGNTTHLQPVCAHLPPLDHRTLNGHREHSVLRHDVIALAQDRDLCVTHLDILHTFRNHGSVARVDV